MWRLFVSRALPIHHSLNSPACSCVSITFLCCLKLESVIRTCGENGDIYTVRYDAVNAVLLNEILKEHRKVEEQNSKIQQQEATIAELKSTVAQQQQGLQTVMARLEQHAAQIQKVSAQLELSKPAPQVVNNP